MFSKLVIPLAVLLLLGGGYAIWQVRPWDGGQTLEPLELDLGFDDEDGEDRETAMDLSGSVSVEPMDDEDDPDLLVEGEDFPLEEGDLEAASFLSHVVVSEFPGRRLVLTGLLSTPDERRTLIEAVQKDLPDGFTIDDQIKLDYRCSPFPWLLDIDRLDFSKVNDIQRFELTLEPTRVIVAGEVYGGDGQALVGQIARVLPDGVQVDDQMKAASRDKASFSVWTAPDQTFLVSGTVPEGDAEAYLNIVRQAMPGVPVVNDLMEDRFLSKPSWEKRIKDFLPGFLRTTQRPGLKISLGNQVRLEGLAQASALSSLRKSLAASFPSPEFQLEIDIQLGVPTETKVVSADVSAQRKPRPATDAKSVEEMVGMMKIYFRSGRSRASQLRSSEIEKLNHFGRLWRKQGFNKKVWVFGFTDASGDAATNAYFSKTRCQNVVAYLKKNFAIDDSYFEIVGTPDNHPQETGTPNELRRVEFSLTDRPTQPPVANWAAAIKRPTNLLKPINFFELYSNLKVVTFGSGKISPSREDRAKLAQMGSAMALEKIEDVMVIYGYSDGKGSRQANEWYTEERCKAVAKEFTKNGVPSDQVIVRPVLSAQPVAPKKDEEPKDKDANDDDGEEKPEFNPRRVELVLMTREAFEKKEAAEAQAAKEQEAETSKGDTSDPPDEA